MWFKTKYALIFTLLTLITDISGQEPINNEIKKHNNLVPNHSFENHGYLPCDRVLTRRYDLFNVDNWGWVNYSSPDVFTTKNDPKCWSHASDINNLKSNFGTILPRTGSTMVGFYTTGKMKNREYHEYLITRLKKPMIPGYKYYVEFWIARCASTSLASNNISAVFLKNPIFNSNLNPIHFQPDINQDKVVHDHLNWTKVSGYYIPKDTMNYMLIGNLLPDSLTKVQRSQAYFKNFYFMTDTYYYLDDIYVIPPDDIPDYEDKNLSEFEKLSINEPFVLKDIYFEHDKTELLPKSYIQLNKVIYYMKKYPSVCVEISGHTDNTGTHEYNIQLSKARADAVKKYLVSKGILDSRIISKAYAEKKPVAPNNKPDGSDNPTGRKLNRRVEFTILKK